MSRVILPFNYQPSLSEVKQTSYTIPAGHYARVTPISADVNIDGVNVCIGRPTTFNTTTLSANDRLYVGTLSRPFYISWSRTAGSGNAQLVVDSSVNGTSGASSPLTSASTSGSHFVDTYASPGAMGVIIPAAAVSSTGNVYLLLGGGSSSGYNIQINPIYMPGDIWLKEGVVVTGDRFFVSLYQSLT